jgi:glycosyltransferase involved in cell wall biosynthesis
VEALGLGKPVIVTEGTWMSAQLQKFGAGLTFRDQDPDDLARAICAARLEYPRLAEQAAARREEWVAYHNPESFVHELLKVAGS